MLEPRSSEARLEAILPALLLGLGVIALLELGSRAGWIPAFVLPAPSAVLVALTENFAVLAGHSAQTLLEVAIGFSLASAFGILTALVMSAVPLLRRMLMQIGRAHV